MTGTAVVLTGPDRDAEMTEPGPDGSVAGERVGPADGCCAAGADVADGGAAGEAEHATAVMRPKDATITTILGRRNLIFEPPVPRRARA